MRPTGKSERLRELRAKPVDREKLIHQNYIFTFQAFIGTTLGGRLTLGTLRWEHFQMEIASFGLGIDLTQVSDENFYLSMHLGLGGKWALDTAGTHDLGFMIGIGGGSTRVYRGGEHGRWAINRVELFPSRISYRYNMASGGCLETGLSVPLVWLQNFIPNIQLFFSVGY
jgi:hypothetical protein